jgi:antitoxin ParD1/3/4
LGPLTELAEAKVREGRYASLSEVLRAGLRALEREEAAFDAILRAKVAEAMADPRPNRSPEEVAETLRRHHEARLARDA